MEDQIESLRREVKQCKEMMKDMKYETGYFAKQKDRDSVIILIFAVIIGYIIYMWWVYQQTAKSPLDNRPRPFQTMRDDTGSTNNASLFRYGVQMPLQAGIKTNSQGDYQFAAGKSLLSAGGLTQSEYGNTMEAQAKSALAGKVHLSGKEPLDRKEHLEPKTTDTYLRKQLM